ncbi:MFS transporter [uncultured Veillonella sp.]|uniref:MFS transporter n=1 Tax=uncultured Veillonella sp. TaxID=159268 RepID=UPI0025953659|nr:MFS transporter [uncultured Veillonella sp.]
MSVHFNRERINREQIEEIPLMTTGTAVLFAAAAGLAIGNLYWAQPLLAMIADDFGVPVSNGGFLVTATQIGYALGIFFFVPLGDVMSRRTLVGMTMGVTSVALLLCSLAPGFSMLAVALGLLGLVTVSGQILLPMAGDLSSADNRGRIVGIVTAGITGGILFARFISGFVADEIGWRGLYVGAAIINTIVTVIMLRVLPYEKRRTSFSYPRLLWDVFGAVKRNPKSLELLTYTGLGFGISFNIFWTVLTYVLAEAPYHYSPFQIGLVSLTSLVGAIAGIGIGRLQDKGYGHTALGVSFALSAVILALAAYIHNSIIAILIVAAVFALAIQGICVLVQSELFALSDTERSRLNTALVVSNFIFAAGGSLLSTWLWNHGGWPMAVGGASLASFVGLVLWWLWHKK